MITVIARKVIRSHCLAALMSDELSVVRLARCNEWLLQLHKLIDQSLQLEINASVN
jgi:hypothetical protein